MIFGLKPSQYRTLKLFIFLDATGSKRFILNVEVTPEHKPRKVSTQQPTQCRQETGTIVSGGGAEKENIISVICNQDIETDTRSCPVPVTKERRSIFSQLGQWLCQGGAGNESFYSAPGIQTKDNKYRSTCVLRKV